MITIPTISQLYSQVIADLETEFGATINPIGKAMLRAFAAVKAAKLKILYLVLGQVQKNVAPDTCDEETLIRYGKIKLNREPFSAVAGQYSVAVTGSSGAVIPAKTTFKSDDNSLNPGVLYVLDNAYTMTSTTGTITLRSFTLGQGGSLDVGNTLTSTSPIPLVDKTATVLSEVVQPLDAENIEDYRAKVILSYRLEAQGGSDGDYRLWSYDAQGVKQVYPYAKSGYPSSIDLFIEANVSDSVDGKGTPTNQTIDDVETVVNTSPDTSLPLNERSRRPTQAMVYYLPVTVKDVVINISSYQNLTSPIQTTITNALKTMGTGIRPFVAGADAVSAKNDVLDGNKIIGTIITAVPGSTFGAVTFTVSGTAYSTYTFMGGEIPFVTTVNFT